MVNGRVVKIGRFFYRDPTVYSQDVSMDLQFSCKFNRVFIFSAIIPESFDGYFDSIFKFIPSPPLPLVIYYTLSDYELFDFQTTNTSLPIQIGKDNYFSTRFDTHTANISPYIVV